MILVQFMLFKVPATVTCRGMVHRVNSESIVLTDALATVGGGQNDFDVHPVYAGDFQTLYRDLADQVLLGSATPFWRDPLTILPLPKDLFEISRRLGVIDAGMFLRFVFIYCLNINRPYFSELIHHFVDGSAEFFDYIERNSMNPWTVETYANELGISMRDLNFMFREKFGVSAKRWLLERRLENARQLLLQTSMKVTEIAHECGFNSHAHFSDAFRKRFNSCPRKVRQEHVGV
ncbi:AraC family transcriptional regulator [Paraburkholderia sediminicola]|uniref:helix-turn-helix transcriptional regulator n=1 Tax=Paraburkholderia sediminicola TaxID=458836 RepID=UPI0038BB4DB5